MLNDLTLCFLSCWMSCSSWRHSASALATSLSPASLVAAMLARACKQMHLFEPCLSSVPCKNETYSHSLRASCGRLDYPCCEAQLHCL